MYKKSSWNNSKSLKELIQFLPNYSHRIYSVAKKFFNDLDLFMLEPYCAHDVSVKNMIDTYKETVIYDFFWRNRNDIRRALIIGDRVTAFATPYFPRGYSYNYGIKLEVKIHKSNGDERKKEKTPLHLDVIFDSNGKPVLIKGEITNLEHYFHPNGLTKH